MIDLHSHFLPGMDDGADSDKESIRMLSEAHKQGVTLCAGTSHIILHGEKSIDSFLQRRENAVSALEKALVESSDIVPKLIYGAEVYLDNDISDYAGVEKLCITDTNLLLVEFSTKVYKQEYAEWLYSLTLKNIVPIIAHVERYPYFQTLLSELDAVNVVYQMNAKTVMKNSWFKYLLDMYYNDKRVLVSSDMHNNLTRKCCMGKAYDKAKKHFNPDIVDDLFERTAAKLIGIDLK